MELDPNGILSLHDSHVETRRLIANLGQNLYLASMCALTPRLKDMFNRLDNPQPGDLVVGASIPNKDKHHRGLGYLLSHRDERIWAEYEQEWLRDVGIWYIQYGPSPDDICRWYNASFTVIPEEILR